MRFPARREPQAQGVGCDEVRVVEALRRAQRSAVDQRLAGLEQHLGGEQEIRDILLRYIVADE